MILTREEITRRLDRHYGPLERPYRCLCGRTFDTLEALHGHISTRKTCGYVRGFRR